MAEINQIHLPVMLSRCIELLLLNQENNSPVIVDATLGMGGHSEAILDAHPTAKIYGFDRDTQALEMASKRLSKYGERFKAVHGTYDSIKEKIREFSVEKIDGVLFDLGVSSFQLDYIDRGFSYSQEAPLDMRMDQSGGISAEEILATYSTQELSRIFIVYGEEKLANRYAKAIVEYRNNKKITSSLELVEILQKATPAAIKAKRHPAKKVFQALRIEVNKELEILEQAIPKAVNLLSINGNAVVLSYHSLEDRFIKKCFQKICSSSAPIRLPQELPEHKAKFKLLVRGAEQASVEEKTMNPRSASVRLRAVTRIIEGEI